MYCKGIEMKYIIYKISIADFIYIGSTQDLKQRKIAHKSSCYNEKHRQHKFKLYQTIRENGGWDCIDITPVEEYECEGATQARIREEYWRREYNAQLNTIKAHLTREEGVQSKKNIHAKYYIANKETILKKNTEYYATNKETILERQKEKIQCECGATICKADKARHDRSKRHIDRIAEQQNNLAVV